MEYFNGKIGRGRAEAVVGMFGLGVSNKREDRLIQFCRDSELKVLNITQTTLDLEIAPMILWEISLKIFAYQQKYIRKLMSPPITTFWLLK